MSPISVQIPIFLFTEHSILSDIEEDCKETFVVPSLAQSHDVDLIKYSDFDLEFYIQFFPFLPGKYVKCKKEILTPILIQIRSFNS